MNDADYSADVESVEQEEEEFSRLEKLLLLSSAEGDITHAISDDRLMKIGQQAMNEYEADKASRKDWEDTVKDAQERAAQESKREAKSWPWPNASDVRYPLLTVSANQFNARAYPAIVRGDEACGVAVVGNDEGVPAMGPDGQPVMQQGPDGQPVPVWAKQPGAKAARAGRLKQFLNAELFYTIDEWEVDTDQLLLQLPIVGCAFRKCYWDSHEEKQRVCLVPALNLVVPMTAKSLRTSPRITEELPDVHPSDIIEKQRSGFYRDVSFQKEGEDGDYVDKPRQLIEQHRLIDLDDDGLPEPYVATVDCETQQVLRLEASYGPEDAIIRMAGVKTTLAQAVQLMVQIQEEIEFDVIKIERKQFYVKYEFFPHPEGKFYGIGLGHLLKEIGAVIDTAINQLNDTATAAAAGGGFIGSGISLQGAGGRGSSLRMEPGEYKTVDAPGHVLRDGIVERTMPQPSPVTFQVLDMMLSAAADISSVKDVNTGEASNNGQVGTTLALIEQSLQMFTAIYKRSFRSLREEFGLLKRNIAAYGGEDAKRRYMELLDDPEANFEADIMAEDMDVRPISDPSSVTRMQKMAMAQFVMSTVELLAAAGGDPREALKRVYLAAGVEDVEKLLPEPQPPQPDPAQLADAEAKKAKAARDMAEAGKTEAETAKLGVETIGKTVETERAAFELGREAA